ncbi:hypothetical protein D3C72_943070 [compost metagenome]
MHRQKGFHHGSGDLWWLERNDGAVSANDLVVGKNGETVNRALAGVLLCQFGGKRVGVHVVLSETLEKTGRKSKKATSAGTRRKGAVNALNTTYSVWRSAEHYL